MGYQLEDIKKIRKKLGLTQHDLAKRASVSQSLIAKIEARKIDPTFSKSQKIFLALEELTQKHEKKASDIMQDKIISINPDTDIKEAIKMMKKFQISQMPVIQDQKSVGLISEATILDAIINEKHSKVRGIMENSPPIVASETPLNVVTSLLKFFPMVLVSNDGNLVGVITKVDVLDNI